MINLHNKISCDFHDSFGIQNKFMIEFKRVTQRDLNVWQKIHRENLLRSTGLKRDKDMIMIKHLCYDCDAMLFLESRVVNWEYVYDENGEEIKFSVEAFRDYCDRHKGLAKQLLIFYLGS